MTRSLFLAALLLAVLSAAASAQQTPLDKPGEPPKPLPVLQTWKGTLPRTAPRDLAPKNHVITDQKQWSDLWTAWRGSEPLPPVDFATEMVLVETAPGQKGFTELLWLKDDVGDLTHRTKVDFDEQPGFSYVMQRVKRDGIRKVLGTMLPR